MTLSIGMSDRSGKVWIGADTSLVAGAMSWKAKEPKVWTQGPWVISGSGDWRPLSLVRHTAKLPGKPHLQDPRKPWDADKVVAIDLTGAMQVALESAGYEADEEAEGDQVGANSWLVGLPGVGLWEIDTKWHAFRVSLSAIGSGWEWALGWLARDLADRFEPERQIKDCIKDASKVFRGSVRTPGIVIGPHVL
jgi:hypothetical protein